MKPSKLELFEVFKKHPNVHRCVHNIGECFDLPKPNYNCYVNTKQLITEGILKEEPAGTCSVWNVKHNFYSFVEGSELKPAVGVRKKRHWKKKPLTQQMIEHSVVKIQANSDIAILEKLLELPKARRDRIIDIAKRVG